MHRDLPPLAALRVFEAAARHLSFTKAAAELGMTQAAVSYQVKLLEERLGAALFLRGRRRLELSDTGAALARPATEALDLMAAGWSAARGRTGGTLSLNVIPSFAASWLARHLGEFQLANPDLAVRVASSQEMADFDREDIDFAVRTGQGDWPGLTAHFLFDAAFTPLLSPKLLERIGGLATPADLARCPMLDPTDPWWDAWFRAVGVERPPSAGRAATTLGAQHLEAVAAVAGHGAAMLTPFFWRAELADGRLVQPFDFVCRGERAYWLCYPTSRRNLPKVRAFRDWLLGHFPVEDRDRSTESAAGPSTPSLKAG
ncbi:LysR substrate-binding domain-containing protein [Aureimonas leprariae]|uniref:LysR family transcriptional regulator n=1 Tax=Plantimonas leprariae TaxID=2615207 RepID=A0A7V7PRR6_9HYPH|nr:LysR substrate-binding domain-containing protein [Aureimonas leprariae]KAB0681494.1 LysR family transcriptional regulator [Aureimonas leprariae]